MFPKTEEIIVSTIDDVWTIKKKSMNYILIACRHTTKVKKHGILHKQHTPIDVFTIFTT